MKTNESVAVNEEQLKEMVEEKRFDCLMGTLTIIEDKLNAVIMMFGKIAGTKIYVTCEACGEIREMELPTSFSFAKNPFGYHEEDSDTPIEECLTDIQEVQGE